MPSMRLTTQADAKIRMPDGTIRDVTLELTPEQMTALEKPHARYSMGAQIVDCDFYALRFTFQVYHARGAWMPHTASTVVDKKMTNAEAVAFVVKRLSENWLFGEDKSFVVTRVVMRKI